MSCDCGCGYEGEDDVAQFLLEEALLMLAELAELPTPVDPAEDATARSLERQRRQTPA